MNNTKHSALKPSFTDLKERLTEVLEEREWLILERHFVHDESLTYIGGEYLSLAKSRVHQIMIKALKKIIESFHIEIEYISAELNKQLSESGGIISINAFISLFPGMGENEFVILFAASRYNQEISGRYTKEIFIDKNTNSIRLV